MAPPRHTIYTQKQTEHAAEIKHGAVLPPPQICALGWGSAGGRRGADRVRPGRESLLGLSDGRGVLSRHSDHGEAHGERPSSGVRGDDRRDSRRFHGQRSGVLQHGKNDKIKNHMDILWH